MRIPESKSFAVEKRALPLRRPAILELPAPAFGEALQPAWREAASAAILNRGVRPFVGAVEIALTFREGRRARQIGDLPNACLELLIATRLIASADSAVLKRLTLAWGPVEGVQVEIRAAERGLS